MKPLNLDNSPCSPTSSNCVIWQGPDLACIKLCKGDTVSDVIAKLATELCTILDQLNVNNYDLACFNSTACPPVDFQALIQFLIDHICALEGVTPVDTTKSTSTCPDCVVSVASCFVQGNQTTMQLVDYVQMIADRVCNILTSIANLQTQITDLDIRVTVLENAPAPTFTLPSILVDCTLQNSPLIGNGGGATPIDVVLSALINDDNYGYCALTTATGLPADILTAVNSQCITSATDSLVYGTPMGTAYSGTWVNDPETAADAITNLWIALCDVFTYSSNNELSVEDTNTVNLTYTAGVLSAEIQDTGWHCLLGFSSFMNTSQAYTYPQVRRIGNQLHFRGQVIIPLQAGGGGPLMWNYSAGTDTYYANTTVTPYQGNGGVDLNDNGSIDFNYSTASGTALSCIPPGVIPAGYALDGSYQAPSGFKMCYRTIDVGTGSTLLSTLLIPVITSAGVLRMGLLKDTEESWVEGNNAAFSSSHLNVLISHVTAGDQVPQYAASGTTIYDNPTAGAQGLDINFATGREYPFTCNANEETDLGGFQILLAGLTAFISPCGNLIPTPDPLCTPCTAGVG